MERHVLGDWGKPNGAVVYGAETTLTEAEGGREVVRSMAEEGVGEFVRGFLGISVAGRRSTFVGELAKAESEENEEGKSRRQPAGQ